MIFQFAINLCVFPSFNQSMIGFPTCYVRSRHLHFAIDTYVPSRHSSFRLTPPPPPPPSLSNPIQSKNDIPHPTPANPYPLPPISHIPHPHFTTPQPHIHNSPTHPFTTPTPYSALQSQKASLPDLPFIYQVFEKRRCMIYVSCWVS